MQTSGLPLQILVAGAGTRANEIFLVKPRIAGRQTSGQSAMWEMGHQFGISAGHGKKDGKNAMRALPWSAYCS